jgi:hypothetical protein
VGCLFVGYGLSRDDRGISKEDPTEEKLDPTEEDKDKTEPPPCQPISVDRTDINTGSMNAKIVKGDSEVDSDDWTSVDLAYQIKKSSRDVQLELKWAVQERNKDQSRGDTRIESKRNFTLFRLGPGGCIISGLSADVVLSADHEEYYRDRVHGQQEFPAIGSLERIRVVFDHKGSDDRSIQSLTASLPGFTVMTRPD